jgi:hypothetical protein
VTFQTGTDIVPSRTRRPRSRVQGRRLCRRRPRSGLPSGLNAHRHVAALRGRLWDRRSGTHENMSLKPGHPERRNSSTSSELFPIPLTQRLPVLTACPSKDKGGPPRCNCAHSESPQCRIRRRDPKAEKRRCADSGKRFPVPSRGWRESRRTGFMVSGLRRGLPTPQASALRATLRRTRTTGAHTCRPAQNHVQVHRVVDRVGDRRPQYGMRDQRAERVR